MWRWLRRIFVQPRSRGFTLVRRGQHGAPKGSFAQKRTPFGGMSRDKRDLLDSPLSKSLEANISSVERVFHAPRNAGLVIRRFSFKRGRGKVRAAILFLDGIVDPATIREAVLKPLLQSRTDFQAGPGPKVHPTETYSGVASGLVEGSTVLLIDGEARALVHDTRSIEHRAIEESPAEPVIRGPHVGFVEDLWTNIALIRSLLATPDLVEERLRVGARSNTLFALVYIEGIVNPRLVHEVRRRLSSIKADFAPTADAVEPYLRDEPWNPFPSVLVTERPDRVASMLADGHVAIVSPSAGVAVVPVTIWDLMHSPEDGYMHFIPASLLRLVRWLAFFNSVYSSALYVALVNYHPEMIPTELLSSIAASREAVPFPAVIEVTAMEVALELIREASVRIPTVLGPTIGVIGGVVLGQAAVVANIVSPILVVVVAISGLGSSAVPNYELGLVLRILKLVMIVAASVLGIPGITVATILLISRTTVTRSFGVPVTAPLVPYWRHSSDTIVRGPEWALGERPGQVRPVDTRRQPRKSRRAGRDGGAQ